MLSHDGDAVAEELFDEAGVVFALAEGFVVHDCLLEGDGGLDAGDHVFVEGARHAVDTGGAAGGGGDDFGDHRIVMRRDRVAGVGVGVDADSASTGCVVEFDIAGAGLEVFLGILGVDAALDSVAARLGLNDIATEMLAGCDLDLLFHEIAAVDFLGDGVLDLDAGVHFHEVEIPVIVDEILDGAGVGVADALAEADRCVAHFFAKLGRHERRGAFFDDFLVAALERAIALAEVDDAAVVIAEDLKLDVVGIDDKFLDVDGAVAESLFGFHAGGVVALEEAAFVACDAHAASATAGDGFDHDWVANFPRDTKGLGFGIDCAVAAGRNGHAGFAGTVARGIFISHEADRLRRGADEFDVAAGADLREVGILGQKSIAGVDGIGVRDFCGADDAVDFEVALGAYGGADANGFVGELHMEAVEIGFRIDGDRLDAEFLAGADDAKSDFAAIGDQDFFEHGGVAGDYLRRRSV